MGSGVGDPFGPSCNKGDVMGCGVLFPRDFESKSDSEEEGELVVRLVENQGDTEEYETDSGEEEEWWRPDVKQGDKVQVELAEVGTLCIFSYFVCRSTSQEMGRLLGRRRCCCPREASTPLWG